MRPIINLFQILFIWVWTIFSATLGFVFLIFIGQKKAIYVSSKIWSYPIIWISAVKCEVHGKENIPKDRNVIFVSNHESSYDIPVLFRSFPVPLFFLAKSELKKIPVFGWFVSAVGMVFVDRGNHEKAMKSLIKAGKEIKKGKNIISFPEGTRPRDGKMKMFKRGSFVLSMETGIDVVPVAIIGSREVNPPGFKIKGGTIKIVVGEPVSPKDYIQKGHDLFAKEMENKVREMKVQFA